MITGLDREILFGKRIALPKQNRSRAVGFTRTALFPLLFPEVDVSIYIHDSGEKRRITTSTLPFWLEYHNLVLIFLFSMTDNMQKSLFKTEEQKALPERLRTVLETSVAAVDPILAITIGCYCGLERHIFFLIMTMLFSLLHLLAANAADAEGLRVMLPISATHLGARRGVNS